MHSHNMALHSIATCKGLLLTFVFSSRCNCNRPGLQLDASRPELVRPWNIDTISAMCLDKSQDHGRKNIASVTVSDMSKVEPHAEDRLHGSPGVRSLSAV